MFKLTKSSPVVAKKMAEDVIKRLEKKESPRMPKIWDNLYCHEITASMAKDLNSSDFNMYTAVSDNGEVCIYADFIKAIQDKSYIFNQAMQSVFKKNNISVADLVNVNIDSSNKRQEAYKHQAQKACMYDSTVIDSIKDLDAEATIIFHGIYITTKAAMENFIEERGQFKRLKKSLNKTNRVA